MPDEIKRLQNELVSIYQQATGKKCGAVPEDSEIIAAYEAAIEALQKQIPKPPIPDENATGDELDIPRSWKCFDCVDYMLGGKCPCRFWCERVDGPRDGFPTVYQKKREEEE